jgi:hypothetical protein
MESKEPTILQLYEGVIRPTKGDIGIEIEMEGRDLPPACAGWRHDRDGSIGVNGLEYVLSAPVDHPKVDANLVNLQQWFDREGAVLEPSDRCGVHVHVNVQQMTFKQVVNYASLYLIMEEPLVNWCGEDRLGNLFCLDAGSADGIVERLIHAIPYGTFRHSFPRDGYRYASINFDAIGKYGSLEFRAMKTQAQFVRPISIWVDTLMRLKEQSLGFKDVLSAVNDFSVFNPIPFARRILGNLYEHYECPGIQEMLLNGVRRVQDVAYAEQVKRDLAPPIPKKNIVFDQFINAAAAAPRPRQAVEPRRENYPTYKYYSIAWHRWALNNRDDPQFSWWRQANWEAAEQVVADADRQNAEERGEAPPPRDRAGRYVPQANLNEMVFLDEAVEVNPDVWPHAGRARAADLQRAQERLARHHIPVEAAVAPRPARARRARRVEEEI